MTKDLFKKENHHQTWGFSASSFTFIDFFFNLNMIILTSCLLLKPFHIKMERSGFLLYLMFISMCHYFKSDSWIQILLKTLLKFKTKPILLQTNFSYVASFRLVIFSFIALSQRSDQWQHTYIYAHIDKHFKSNENYSIQNPNSMCFWRILP